MAKKRKARGKATTKIKNKQKVDKMKDIMPMVLTDGYLEKIGDII